MISRIRDRYLTKTKKTKTTKTKKRGSGGNRIDSHVLEDGDEKMFVLVCERKKEHFTPFEFSKAYKSFETALKHSEWISQEQVVLEKSEECWVVQHRSAGKICLAYLVDVSLFLDRAVVATKTGCTQSVMCD